MSRSDRAAIISRRLTVTGGTIPSRIDQIQAPSAPRRLAQMLPAANIVFTSRFREDQAHSPGSDKRTYDSAIRPAAMEPDVQRQRAAEAGDYTGHAGPLAPQLSEPAAPCHCAWGTRKVFSFDSKIRPETPAGITAPRTPNVALTGRADSTCDAYKSPRGR